jgi:hypothetical protein
LLEAFELPLQRLEAILRRQARASQLADLGLRLPELLGELVVVVGAARGKQGAACGERCR